jgi:hypothetical protein
MPVALMKVHYALLYLKVLKKAYARLKPCWKAKPCVLLCPKGGHICDGQLWTLYFFKRYNLLHIRC